MNEDAKEAQESSWDENHPWLSHQTAAEDDDSVDEVIRYTLDELQACLAHSAIKMPTGQKRKDVSHEQR